MYDFSANKRQSYYPHNQPGTYKHRPHGNKLKLTVAPSLVVSIATTSTSTDTDRTHVAGNGMNGLAMTGLSQTESLLPTQTFVDRSEAGTPNPLGGEVPPLPGSEGAMGLPGPPVGPTMPVRATRASAETYAHP